MVLKQFKESYMPRNNRVSDRVKRALARRKGKKINNLVSHMNDGTSVGVPSPTQPNVQVHGLVSTRDRKWNFNPVKGMIGEKIGSNVIDIQPKQIMHPDVYWELWNYWETNRGPGDNPFRRGGSRENIGTISDPGGGTRWSGTENGPCKYFCNGHTIWVAPGDCVRCPENAYCPDNLKCSTAWRGADNFIDIGWACCGCRAEYGDGSHGPPGDQNTNYGKKLGWTFSLWSGDNDCDDGKYISSYYACRNRTCGPPTWQIHDDETTPDGLQFYSGPWDFTGPNQPGANTEGHMAHHMFYWADDQYDMHLDYLPGGIFECDCQYNGFDLGGMGAGFPHLACPEWGWDCGDVLNRNGPETGCDRHGCARFAIDAGDELMDEYGSFDECEPDGGFGDLHSNIRTPFLGDDREENDPNRHCGWLLSQGGTCKGKCNRRTYLDPASPYFIQKPGAPANTGWDPGGVEFRSGFPGTGQGPSQCFCDYECPFCGCNYDHFAVAIGQVNDNGATFTEEDAITLYTDCLRNCPGDCGPPNHNEHFGDIHGGGLEEGYPIPSDWLGGGGNKLGSQPGITCAMHAFGDTPANFGDCCQDYWGECVVERSPLPCECYTTRTDVPSTIPMPVNFLPECRISNPGQDDYACSYAGVLGDASSDGNCGSMCMQFCAGGGAKWKMEYDAWETQRAQVDNDNRLCAMEWINREIVGEDNMNLWQSTPWCEPYYSTHSYSGGSCKCECGCAQASQYNNGGVPPGWPPNKEANPTVGCGGLLPLGHTEDMYCNHDSTSYNCSKEYITSLNDDHYDYYLNVLVSGGGIGPDCIPVSLEDYLSNGDLGTPSQNKIPRRVLKLYFKFAAYNSEDVTCNANAFEQLVSSGGTTVCQDAENLYALWIGDLTKGCMGCPDPNAGNYTGSTIKNSQGQPMGCDGGGLTTGTDCCWYETGCNSVTAINWLDASENENNTVARGGLNHPTLDDTPLTVDVFCQMLDDIADSAINERTECQEAGYFISNPNYGGATQSSYVYCFAPNGCEQGNEDTCDYTTVEWCGDPQACNYSEDCATCGAGEGNCFTLVNGVETPCAYYSAGGWCTDCCYMPHNFCEDSDGDCMWEDETVVALGCNNPGAGVGPDDAMGYWQGSDFQSNHNGLVGYLYYPTSSPDQCSESNLGMIVATGQNGYDLVPCDEVSEDAFPNCPTNQTHLTHGGRTCSDCGSNLAFSYPVGSGQFWFQGSDFDINHCCSTSASCLNPATAIEGVGEGGIRVPCCYRDDDCGVCNLPNDGIFVITEGGVYQDGTVPLAYVRIESTYGCNLATAGGGMGIWGDNDCGNQTVGIGTAQYYETSTGQTYCSCSLATSLSCNCNSTSENDAGNVCGTAIGPDCAGVCGGTGSDDECGICEGGGAVDGCCPINQGICSSSDPMTCGEGTGPGTGSGPCCGTADCNLVCGGGGAIYNFSVDGDNDGYCAEGSSVDYCSNDPSTDRPGATYILTADCEDVWDQDDNIACSTNNIDDCNQCVGVDVPEFNYNMDCNGVCFGTNVEDDCDQCACFPGTEGTCGDTYNTWNADIDECGLCDPAVNIEKSVLETTDVLRMPLTMTYGSFGCSQEDWFAEGNPNHDASGGTCGPRTDLITGAYDGTKNGIKHCGCQCAGCTNIASPVWAPYAKYDIGYNGAGSWNWNYGENLQNVGGNDPYCGEYNGCNFMNASSINICQDGSQGFDKNNIVTEAWQTMYDRFGQACSAASRADWGYLCVYFQDAFAGNMDSSGGMHQPICILGDEIVNCDTAGAIQTSAFQYYNLNRLGWYWHGNLKWRYCDNPLPGRSECMGESDPVTGSTITETDPTCIDNCTAGGGGEEACRLCCGYVEEAEDNVYHCRSGERSELHWYIDRAGGGEAPGLDLPEPNEGVDPPDGQLGDVNFDNSVNIQDIVQTINYILGNLEFSADAFQRADVNEDGTVNILDIVGIVQIILDGGLRGGNPLRHPLTNWEEDQIIRNLKPLFNNSVYTRRVIRKKPRQHANYPTRDNNNTRTQYNFDYFKFLLNAPTCMDPGNPPDISFGEGFETWAAQAEWGEHNGLLTLGTSGIIGNTDVTVSIGFDNLLFAIYHPNVVLQSDPQIRQVGTTERGNVIVYIPEGVTAECSGNRPENDEYCDTWNEDLEACDSEPLCVVTYTGGEMPQPYEELGTFGWDFVNWSWFYQCGLSTGCSEFNQWYYPGQREDLYNTDSCDSLF